ncbi:MAG: thioredoxin domain-containing protein [Phycisphaerae bacterium]|nr:thioredoxin domain-containing protein [Phycisphaerae bacterium]
MTAPRPPLVPALGQRDHIVGPPEAPHTLVIYGDYQCAHCKAAHDSLWPLLGRFPPPVRLGWRHFPLARLHPLARHAAMAAEFAGAAGKFWQMHGLLFYNQPRLEMDCLLAYAEQLGLVPGQMRSALEQGVYAARLQEDLSSGVRSGVNSTPTLYMNGRRHNGGYTQDVVLEVLALESADGDSKGAAG